jgi:hypothetical protein
MLVKNQGPLLVKTDSFALGAFAKAKNGFLLSIAALGLIIGAPFLARLSRRLKAKIILDLPGFLHLLERRKIPLVLHLREFHRDLEKDFWDVEGGVVSSWEESLLADLRAYGAVLAVGIPGETLPHGGAYRLYLGAEWKITVEKLMDLASAILLLLCHKRGAVFSVPHHGQCARLESSVRACRQRIVVMEVGLCRATRRGSAARAETFG